MSISRAAVVLIRKVSRVKGISSAVISHPFLFVPVMDWRSWATSFSTLVLMRARSAAVIARGPDCWAWVADAMVRMSRRRAYFIGGVAFFVGYKIADNRGMILALSATTSVCIAVIKTA